MTPESDSYERFFDDEFDRLSTMDYFLESLGTKKDQDDWLSELFARAYQFRRNGETYDMNRVRKAMEVLQYIENTIEGIIEPKWQAACDDGEA